MATTFNVIFLGNGLGSIDVVEGDRVPSSNNSIADNAAVLETQSFGAPGNPIWKSIQEFSPGPSDFAGGVSDIAYDTDNSGTGANETFRIDGGAPQTFDGTALYNATITYTDDTPPASITAVIFQDTAGNTYLAPEFSVNEDQAALEAAPLETITLDSLNSDEFAGLTADRQTFSGFVCFASGTLIDTPKGPVPVETLAAGDQINTMDNGAQPLLWVGSKRVAATGNNRPVRIEAGALGGGLPLAPLVVSRQHRVLAQSRVAERMFGTPEVLCAAHHLKDLSGIHHDDQVAEIEYCHIMCERHEIVFANGAPTETMLYGEETRETLPLIDRLQILAALPGLRSADMGPVRLVPAGARQRGFIRRIIKNRRNLLDAASLDLLEAA